jgi:hypothetical protein
MSDSFHICMHLHEMYMIKGSMEYMISKDIHLPPEQVVTMERQCKWFNIRVADNQTIHGWRANGDDLDEWIMALWYAVDEDLRLQRNHIETLRRLAWWLDDVVSSELPPETVHSSPMVVKAREVG